MQYNYFTLLHGIRLGFLSSLHHSRQPTQSSQPPPPPAAVAPREAHPFPPGGGHTPAAVQSRRLREATGKSVDIVFPKPAAANGGSGSGREEANAAAQAQAQAQAQALLLAAGLQQQPQQHGRPWYALQQGGYGPPPEPYLASYPATAWGAYPHNGLDGAYGGGWFGY